MHTTTPTALIFRSALLAATLALSAQAGLLVNGGFESGLAGWTTAHQVGSEGTFALQTGTLSPVNGLTVLAPPEGTRAAMTDAAGPGSHVLYQDFVVPASVPAAFVSFSLFINTSAPDFFVPTHLDFATLDLNQQARADILLSSADPFSTAPTDILLALHQTLSGDPLTSGYTPFHVDLTALLQAHAGQTLRLRFAEVDNVDVFNLGVDAVDIQVVPEPELAGVAAGVMCLVAIGLLGRARRRGKPRGAGSENR